MPAIRPVRPRDAAACAAIYNYYIENTTVTMELTPLCEADFQKRIETITAKFPWLVYEEDGRILGYGYLSYFHERAAYRFVCDLSLYVDKEARGRKIGSALLEELEKRGRECGFVCMMSLISSENTPSEAFHRKHGFEKTAEIPGVAFKFKRWMGLLYYKKMLAACADPEKGENPGARPHR